MDEQKINELRYMYITARQFKNAIENDSIIPTPTNNFRNKIYPFIVNKSFSCEIYLKLILLYKKNKKVKIHSLKELSKDTGIDIEFKNHLYKNKFKISDEDFEECINSISNAFEEWRYIYEKKDITIRNGFLNSYCNYLDDYCKSLLKEKCNIDVDKELIYI